jgi:hypothetical protein
MKTIFVLASLIMAPYAAAANTRLNEANHYVCREKGGLSVTMDTTGLDGKPRLYLSGPDIQPDLLSATELERTIMGHRATVSEKYLSDLSVHYTFIAPEVMTTLGKNQPVQGILIKTSAGGIIDPSMIPGPIQKNSVLQLSCQATFVIF